MNRDMARCADLCFKLDCDRNLIHIETGKVYNFSSFADQCPDYSPLLDFSEFTTSELLRLIEPTLQEPRGYGNINIDHYTMFDLVSRLDPKSGREVNLNQRDKEIYESLMNWLGLSLLNLPWYANATPSSLGLL